LLHSIIRQNYGCSHFIIGRDHAGPGNDSQGKPFYGDYDAQNLVSKYLGDLKIQLVLFKMVAYVPSLNTYLPENELADGMETKNISGTELRKRLTQGLEIPEWFSFPSVVKILRESYPPRSKQGFTIFFTGLSGSGKSTCANALLVKLLQLSSRSVSLLDGDGVRRHLSSELGFSKEHRDLNIRRIGFVASEITRAGGVALTAAIAPYEGARSFVRDIVSRAGGYVEVYLATPIEVCEQRDRKGLYKKARSGQLKGFTGIDDPYEEPSHPELHINTGQCSVHDVVDQVVAYLTKEGYLEQKNE